MPNSLLYQTMVEIDDEYTDVIIYGPCVLEWAVLKMTEIYAVDIDQTDLHRSEPSSLA